MTPLDPPPDRDLPAGRLEQRRAHLVRELRGAKRRGRRALRGLMIVPGVAVLGVGAAWAAGVFDHRITQPETVECYAAPSLSAKHTPAYLDQSTELPSPQAQCAPFFARGYLAADRRVPPLRACLGDGRVSVFPATDDEVCRRLRLEPLPASVYRAETTRILRAFRLVNAEIERALENGGADPYTVDSPTCLRGSRGVARLQVALKRARLTDFRVRPAAGADTEDCFTDVNKPEPFDGRTIELLTEATHGAEAVDAGPEISKRDEQRRCDRVRAEAARRGAGGLLDVLDCEIQPSGCLTVGQTRARAQRALQRARLEGWLVTVGRERGASGAKLSPSTVGFDPRLREVRISLTECP